MVSQRLMATAIGKVAGEAILTPFIGNGTLLSGLAKMASGGIARKAVGDSAFSKGLVDGLIVDGFEDVIRALRTGQAFSLGTAVTGGPGARAKAVI